jgi:hypothetical protein
MAVVVDFALMPGVSVVVGTMIAPVIMRVPQSISRMVMFVFVFVHVFVRMGMVVLMDVLLVPVCMLMRVSVGVFVGVGMAVFMIAVHFQSSLGDDQSHPS